MICTSGLALLCFLISSRYLTWSEQAQVPSCWMTLLKKRLPSHWVNSIMILGVFLNHQEIESTQQASRISYLHIPSHVIGSLIIRQVQIIAAFKYGARDNSIVADPRKMTTKKWLTIVMLNFAYDSLKTTQNIVLKPRPTNSICLFVDVFLPFVAAKVNELSFLNFNFCVTFQFFLQFNWFELFGAESVLFLALLSLCGNFIAPMQVEQKRWWLILKFWSSVRTAVRKRFLFLNGIFSPTCEICFDFISFLLFLLSFLN